VGVAVLADVVELVDQDDVRACLAAGIGEATEGRDDRVVVVAEVAPREDSGPVDGHWFDHDHPGTAEHALPVVADMALPGKAVLGHVGGVCPKGDPAPQGPVTKAEWLED